MFRYFICLVFLFLFQSLRGNTIEIRYHVPEASEVIMIWGINDWNTITDMPVGTIIKDKVMHTPMVKQGENFVLIITLTDNTFIDYLFEFKKSVGPFNTSFEYLDMNLQPDKKYYQTVVKNNMVITQRPDLTKVLPATEISTFKYSALFLLAFSVSAIVLLAWKKYILKTPLQPINQTYFFLAISLTLLSVLIIIRAIITGVAVRFLFNPLQAFPLLFKTSFQDFLYTCTLTLIFGSFFFIKKNRRPLILWLFVSFAILSILIGMVNIQVTALLGRPFTYQWLYYSDFLKSTDALKAISANVEKKSLASYIFMSLTVVPLALLIYQLVIKKPVLTFLIFIGCLGIGYVAHNDFAINAEKKENPVIYFFSSLSAQNGLSILSSKNDNDKNEFTVKNKNVVQPQYASKFSQATIKNVIVFVLESAPAEYLTPFNSKFKTTPFLDSIKTSAVLFNNIYAHVPATNKSLVSILCSAYPYLSYKSITAEKPAISWPSIPSELKKYGYSTSFLNSGDNRFQGAENFLQHRGFNEIEDYRLNSCEPTTFSDIRYSNENLEGINDSCLAVKFFNWINSNPSTPFFSMMWTYQTHYPYYSTGTRIDFHTNNESQEKYLNALHHADKTLQQLVEGLKKRDLFKSTLIVVLGDHGEAFGRHGQTSHAGAIFEENLHIPLMLINPILFKGEFISEVGGISDVAPTIFSILNKPVPDLWQGENLFSVNRRNKVYFFSPYSDYLFGCREGNYKFIYNATSNTYSLYNLKNDPNETINIADKHPQYMEATKKHLTGWMQYQRDYVNSFLK